MKLRDEVEAIAVGPSVAPRTGSAAVRRWLGRADVRAALVATLGLRLLCSLAAAIFPVLAPGLYPWLSPYQADHFHKATYPPNTPIPHYTLLDYFTQPWNRWDTVWYMDIAQHGYATYGSTAFMPLYPVLVRLATPLMGGTLLVAGLLVSTIAAFFAFLALHHLIERLAPGRGLAPFALLVAALLPTAFFFVAAYTESLYLALALWSIVTTMDHQWGRAAVLAGLATLTRQQGILLAVLAAPAAWTVAHWLWSRLRPSAQRRSRSSAPAAPSLPDWRPLAFAAVPPLVYGGWMAFVARVLRAPLPWTLLVSSDAWNLRFTWPGSGLIADVALLVDLTRVRLPMTGNAVLELAASLTTLAGLALAVRRLPPGLTLYLAALWCSSLIKVLPNGLTMSEGRYMLQLLPLCLVPATWLAGGGRLVRIGWIVASMSLLLLYLWAFVLWSPIT